MRLTWSVLLVGTISIGASSAFARDEPRPMTLPASAFQTPRFEPAEGFAAEGVKGIFYEGPRSKGKPTKVFAWVGVPKLEPGKKAPGIVLVHGGGGTAFDAWVRLWVSRGYAAIAMDTCGSVPKGTYGNWQRHDAGGPPGWGGFALANDPIEDQWPYHAVTDVILAHSLLRSMPEVDPDRIGITGISWGGYLTCLTSGLDDRFKFAVPVYGCGFLGENSVWVSELKKLGATGDRWLAMWDPSHYLKNGKMPKLWVTGTNDFAYPLDSLQKSYRSAGGRQTLCIRLRMPHGHGGAGENPEEIATFANAIVNVGKPLSLVDELHLEGDQVSATFKSDIPPQKAELLFTEDEGLWHERLWKAGPATLDLAAMKVSATVPAKAKVVFLNVINERGEVVSSDHRVLTDENPSKTLPAVTFRVDAPPADLKLPPFYKKHIAVGNLPVIASEKVSDFALFEAASLIREMLAARPDVLEAMAREKVTYVVMSTDERTTDLPEQREMTPARYWDRRARGLGGRVTSCGEENLLNLKGDPYHTENLLVHEFAHAIHDYGISKVDPAFLDRLEAAYKNAKETGLWKGTYAISDVHEYWAEGVQSWFDTNRHDDNQHNHVDTREELETYDPLLYKIIAETFRRTDWRYTRPDQRKDPAHLAGFDRANAPEFRWQRERKTSPKVSASFTSPSDRVEDAVDRKTEFSPEPRNRWTSDGSPNAEDWLALDFGEEPTIDRIEISIYDDGKTVLAPKAYRIEVGDGKEWRDVADVVKTPDEPKGGVVNIATFPPVKASHLRVIFTNQERAKSGVTEIEMREK